MSREELLARVRQLLEQVYRGEEPEAALERFAALLDAWDCGRPFEEDER